MCSLVCTGSCRTVCIYVHEVSGERSQERNNEVNWEGGSLCKTEDRLVPRSSKWGQEDEKGGEWSVLRKPTQLSPDLSLSYASRTSHCLSSYFLSDVIPCKRSSTSHSVSFFSHCLMALEPAMLPWEPAGDSRRPLHLFPFIPFWKWIKCFLFRLAWKMCLDSRVLKFAHSRYLI